MNFFFPALVGSLIHVRFADGVCLCKAQSAGLMSLFVVRFCMRDAVVQDRLGYRLC